MKAVVALIVCLSATVASGLTVDERIDRLQTDNLAVRDRLVSTETKLALAEKSAEKAADANAEQAAAFQREIDQLKAKHKAELADVQGKLDEANKILGRWYVRAVLWVADLFFWLSIAGLSIYAIMLIGLCFKTTSPIFQVAWELVSWLPVARPFEWVAGLFHRIMPVRAVEVPAPPPPAPAAVAVSPEARVAMERYAAGLDLAVQPEPQPQPQLQPQASVMSQAFFGQRSVGEILQGVRRGPY